MVADVPDPCGEHRVVSRTRKHSGHIDDCYLDTMKCYMPNEFLYKITSFEH